MCPIKKVGVGFLETFFKYDTKFLIYKVETLLRLEYSALRETKGAFYETQKTSFFSLVFSLYSERVPVGST